MRSAKGEPVTVDRAALAFSVLPTEFAHAVHERLTMPERVRLREGLARVRDASDTERFAALRALSVAARRGVVFPRPAAHDDASCPFGPVARHQPEHIVAALERVSRRDPLLAVVALCHFAAEVRQPLWEALTPDAQAALRCRLDDVHRVSAERSREYARDLNRQVTQALRSSPPPAKPLD